MKKYIKLIPTYLASVIITLVLCYLTLVPKPLPNIENPFLHFDKLVHILMFFIVYIIYAFDYIRQERQHTLSFSVLLVILMITILLGGFIELAQGTALIHRGCDIWDFVADSIGAILAFVFCRPIMKKII